MSAELTALDSCAPTSTGALDTGETRAALRRHRCLGRRIAAIGWLALILCAVVSNSAVAPSRDLEAHGRRTVGVIVDVKARDMLQNGRVTVRYSAGSWREQKVWIDDPRTRYDWYQRVTVFYDPSDPTRMTIAGEHDEGPAIVWPFMVLFIVGAAAMIGWFRMALQRRRWRRILAHSEWREYDYSYADLGGRDRTPVLTLTPPDRPDAEATVVVLDRTLRRMKPFRTHAVPRLWLAGEGPGPVVAASPGPDQLYAARVVHRAWA